METVEAVVVGGGVIGLACARALAQAGRETLLLEAGVRLGGETSSRNSEVIHAGLYYPPGSLKARLCVSGRQALYAYCRTHDVPARQCGKLIVAADDNDMPALEGIAARAQANGVDDLVTLNADAAKAMEPALACHAALFSPATGIIDSHRLMLAYEGDVEDAGGMIALRTPVLEGQVLADGIRLSVGGDAPMTLKTPLLVNSAGLGAQALAGRIDGLARNDVPPLFYGKGNYFTLTGRAPFSHLIYPVPFKAGLGVHLCFDLAGRARFGPDIEWVEGPDYDVDPARAAAFYDSVRRYWPDLPDDSLQPDYAGIRPKVKKPGGQGEDFVIQGPECHGQPGYIGLYGMESPGLTASLTIADYVCALAGITTTAAY